MYIIHSILLMCMCFFNLEINLFTNAKVIRVIGGYYAKEYSFPYTVSLRKNGTHNCGGSILNKRWILTAAHCILNNNKSKLTVVAGTNFIDKGGITYNARNIIPHPEFTLESGENDIGLVKLEKRLTYGRKIRKIRLTIRDVPENTEMVTVGWGLTSFPGDVASKLKGLKVFSISNEKCAEVHSGAKIYPAHICAGNELAEGTCYGDSGGPLVRDGCQVGVISWVIPCAKGKPDVFTRIKNHLNWIRDTVKLLKYVNSTEN